jgi:hypothetical protein
MNLRIYSLRSQFLGCSFLKALLKIKLVTTLANNFYQKHPKRISVMSHFGVVVFFIFFFYAESNFAQQAARDYAVQLSAEVLENPAPKIIIRWLPDDNVNTYSISRKTRNSTTWQPLATLSGTDSLYADMDITAGMGYEYKVTKYAGNGANKYLGSGFIYAGLRVLPAMEYKRILILVDHTVKDSLAAEIERLEIDLAAEGWDVIVKPAPRAEKFDSAKIKDTKKIIFEEHERKAGLKAILLLGRIAVPYSGNLVPDGHPDHKGAWPADVYYGDKDETFWRDRDTVNTSAKREENHNKIGDGKFDPSAIPSDIDFMVGRVDMYNMPAFAKTEIELLRQYLDKNHSFRTRKIAPQNRAVIDDNFNAMRSVNKMPNGDTIVFTEAPAASAWRGFSALLGSENVSAGDWFTVLGSSDYLWAYASGSGIYSAAAGVGTTADFASKPVNAIFASLFGSYFGDWDSQDNFLRAPLASTPMALTSVWMGNPHLYFHHMGLGEPIGYSTLISQNNLSTYVGSPFFYLKQMPQGSWFSNNARKVHIALMGDPTLTQQPVRIAQPGKVTVNAGPASGVEIHWEVSSDENIAGYLIYRSLSNDDFELLTKTSVPGNQFVDTDADLNQDSLRYLVTAVKLMNSVSGTYYAASSGAESEQLLPLSVEKNNSFKTIISPNPANSSAKIFLNPEESISSVEILDVKGNLIYSFDGQISQQVNFLTWNLSDASDVRVSAGIYLLKISSRDRTVVQKLVVMP